MIESPSLPSEGESRKISKNSLPRLLGPVEAITIVVGSIIGSGIFLKVDKVAGLLGAFWPILLVWGAVGLITLCGALAFAELAAMLPHAGGPYVYLREAYGRPVAFLWGWGEFVMVRTGTLGSLACATVIYLNRFLESVAQGTGQPAWLTSILPLSHLTQGILSILIVMFLTALNARGTQMGATTQNITTYIKVGFLLLLLAGPFFFGGWDTNNLAPTMPQDLFTPSYFKAIGLAMLAIYWPYDGWVNIGPVAEEIRDPQRNVPLGLIAGMFIVIGVYVGAIVGYHLTLPMAQVQQSTAIAAEVFEKIWGLWGATLASLGVMISTFGALNSNLLAGPRIYFAMARDGLFPQTLCRVHSKFQTPFNATLAQGSWSLLQIVVVFCVASKPSDAFDTLTDFVILSGTIFYMLSVAAVIVLRFRQPQLVRPYRCWGYPLTPILYLLASLAVLASCQWQQIAAVTGLLSVGAILYFLFAPVERQTS